MRAVSKTSAYKLCPRCFRALPLDSAEVYCPNDGQKLLTACPKCQALITSPFARHCVSCGHSLSLTGQS